MVLNVLSVVFVSLSFAVCESCVLLFALPHVILVPYRIQSSH